MAYRSVKIISKIMNRSLIYSPYQLEMKRTITNYLIIILSIVAMLMGVLSCSNYYNNNAWYYDEESKYFIDIDEITQFVLSNNKKQEDVIVAVIDAGVDTDCKSIQDSLWKNPKEQDNEIDDDHNGYVDDIYGWNFIDNNGIVSNNENSHGTSIAGIISSKDNNCPGIARDTNAKIMILKVLNNEGETDDIAAIIEAIQYAENNGASICNMSLSTEEYSPALENAIASSKMLFVVSSGNGTLRGKNIDIEPEYPASFSCENIISVGAANRLGDISSISNYGNNNVDILAPGEDILVCLIDNRWDYRNGTSYAAAFVTGLATVFYSSGKTTSREVKNKLLENAIVDQQISMYIKGGRLLSSNCF